MPANHRAIADALRRRIATLNLKPGKALPSVRALARKWNVAPGTAAHALRVLVAEGIVRAMPRSGFHVVGVRAEADPELSQERIVAAGVRMADLYGLASVTIRALAEQLSSRPMSIYRHVESKDQLTWLMVDAALGGESMPEVAGLSWRAGLEACARQEWRAMRKHPWLSRALHVSRPGAQPNALAFAERVMAVLAPTRLPAHEKLMVHILLHSFVQGLGVNVEAETQATRDSGMNEHDYMAAHDDKFSSASTAARYPNFGKVVAELSSGFDPSFDVLFEEGLKALLDGFEQRPALRRSGSPDKRAKRSRSTRGAPASPTR